MNNNPNNNLQHINTNPAKDALEDSPVDGDHENDIDAQEKDLLDNAGHDADDNPMHRADLDDTDTEGELLNEKTSATDRSGSDLDVPGSEDDDEDEDIGEEDEENNSYSLKDGDS
jgi:hypothetical protein